MIVTKVVESIEDLVGKVVANYIADRDVSSNVVIETPKNINFNKTGKYIVKYSITDSDKNTITAYRSIAVID